MSHNIQPRCAFSKCIPFLIRISFGFMAANNVLQINGAFLWPDMKGTTLSNVAMRCNRSRLIRVQPKNPALREGRSCRSVFVVVVFEVAWVLGDGLKNNFKDLRHKWGPDEARGWRHILLVNTPALRVSDNNEGNTWLFALRHVQLLAQVIFYVAEN